MIRSILVATCLALTSPVLAQDIAAEPAITAEIIEYENGSLALVHDAVIDAPVDQVWATLSTVEGWKMWGPKEAWFDFRLGGTIETSYVEGSEPGSDQNIIHRILAFIPERMVALQVEQAPAGGFDSAIFDGTWAVYELEPLGPERTRLRITGLGYKSDDASMQILEFFKSGNTYSIEVMKKALAEASGDEE